MYIYIFFFSFLFQLLIIFYPYYICKSLYFNILILYYFNSMISNILYSYSNYHLKYIMHIYLLFPILWLFLQNANPFIVFKNKLSKFFIHKLFNYIYDYSSRLYLATHTFLYFTCLIIHIMIISSYVYLLLLVLFCFTWFKKI